jgi:L-alanine-DL-glutamate epimerase-like enolase superfamily enzyme
MLNTYIPAIDSITITHYRLPLDPPFHAAWDPKPRQSHTVTLVRVRAGDYEGIGSGDAMLGFEGHEHLFVGSDPFAIERHVQLLDNLQFMYGRCWPLEIALWDLMGKISRQPLWKLLGGKRNRLPLYASMGQRRPIDERAAAARGLQALGFRALKVRFYAETVAENLAVARAVRTAIGSDMALLVDANQGWRMPWDIRSPWDLKMALYVADALAELDAFWLEEPLWRSDYRGLAELRRRAKVRIAGGEGNRDFSEHLECLHHGSLDVYQADVVWSTGILRARQLAQAVQAAGAIFSPHTWGDGLVLLANLHVSAAVSNAPFIEFGFDPPQWSPERRDYILPSPLFADAEGCITLSDAPGLGVEIDWQALEPLRIHSGAMQAT